MEPREYTLLVVDDNPENRDLLSRRLERKGFTVIVAADGPEALSLIETRPVDLVLLDVMMPGMSGLDVLKQVRKTRPAAELPIVMATARTESEHVVEALELGANDYVTKPIDFPVVLARVRAQLRAKKPRKAEEAASAAAAFAEALSAPPRIGPGSILADRYRLESKIGSGAFGTVYRATHLELDNPVAVKVLQTNVETGSEAVARFRREGISACRVKHPSAVSVLDFGVSAGGVAYLVMELLEGHSLAEELERRRTFSSMRCVEILLPVCEALSEAHKAGVVHRDVKPSNIFLHRTPRGEVVKVLDFGIAKIADSAAAQSTIRGTVLGTPAYMAPERLSGQPYDGKADVYALGVMLYQMLEGRPPFLTTGTPLSVALKHVNEPPPPFRAMNPAAGTTMEAVIMEALAKKPAERPTAAALARNLSRAVGELGDAATMKTPAWEQTPGEGGSDPGAWGEIQIVTLANTPTPATGVAVPVETTDLQAKTQATPASSGAAETAESTRPQAPPDKSRG
jgi:serine/threonine protein kinase/CheY-like chemotaxis protein